MALAERLLRRGHPIQGRRHLDVAPREPRQALPGYLLDVVELRATAMLVASGQATQVTLANVRSRPGLLWEARKIAADEGVDIVVLNSRENGTVDLRVAPVQREAGEERHPEGG